MLIVIFYFLCEYFTSRFISEFIFSLRFIRFYIVIRFFLLVSLYSCFCFLLILLINYHSDLYGLTLTTPFFVINSLRCVLLFLILLHVERVLKNPIKTNEEWNKLISKEYMICRYCYVLSATLTKWTAELLLQLLACLLLLLYSLLPPYGIFLQLQQLEATVTVSNDDNSVMIIIIGITSE